MAYAGEFAYVDGHGRTFVPDHMLDTVHHSDVLRPCRGYAASLAVENADGRVYGWILTTRLGYPDVKAWMAGVRYTVQTEHEACGLRARPGPS